MTLNNKPKFTEKEPAVITVEDCEKKNCVEEQIQ